MPATRRRYIATRKDDGALLWAETISVHDQMSDEVLSSLIRYTLKANHSRAIGLLDREIDITISVAPADTGGSLGDTFM